MTDDSVFYSTAHLGGTDTVRFGQFCFCLIYYLYHDLGLREAVIVMDNVKFHRSKIIRELFEQPPVYNYEVRFMPPYSPFLDPVESVFSQLKSKVKANRPFTDEELLQSIQDATKTVTAQHCRNYYAHCRSFYQKCLNMEDIQGD